MSSETKAVFLSYASQDSEAAKRICESLRQAGVEVWFDQSELRGGDAWDEKIRKQIRECALFVPVISANTQARHEGYFRLEWRLADQRTHLMGKAKAFVVPVCVDDTRDADADVPDSFLAVQWLRIREGEATPAFCERIQELLAGEPAKSVGRDAAANRSQPNAVPGRRRRPRWVWPVLAGVAIVALGLGLTLKFKPGREPGPVTATANPPTTPSPAEKLSPARELVARARQITQGGSLSRDQLDAAGELCDRALKLDPTDAAVWAEAARTDLQLIFPYGYDRSPERRQQALARATRARNLAPDSIEVRLLYAQVIAHAGGTPALLQEAETILRELHGRRPADREVTGQLAEVLRDSGRLDEAAKLFESLGEFELAGWSYHFEGKADAALAMIDRQLAVKRSVTALMLKALVYLVYREDLRTAQKVIEQLSPVELLNEMPAAIAAEIYLFQRNADRVKQVMQGLPVDYLDSNAFRGPRQYFTGLADEIAGRAGPAAAEWRAGLKAVETRMQSDPDNRDLLLWAAWLQASLGHRPEAERLLTRAQQVAGLDATRVDEANARVFLRLGRDDDVLDWLEQNLPARSPRWTSIYMLARFSPDFDRLRSNPRFEKLLRDNLPEGARPFDEPKLATGR